MDTRTPKSSNTRAPKRASKSSTRKSTKNNATCAQPDVSILNRLQTSNNIFRAYKTILEMLNDRGYTIFRKLASFETFEDSGHILTELDYTTNIDLFTEKTADLSTLTLLKEHCTSGEKMYVFFYDDKIGVKMLKESIVKPMEANHIHRAIIVSVRGGKLTGIAEKDIEKLKPKLIIEHFFAIELMQNISHHKLQPKFYIMSEDEKREILEMYNLQLSNVPRILSKDPMAKYLGLRPGQMVRIERQSPSAGMYETYRICHK